MNSFIIQQFVHLLACSHHHRVNYNKVNKENNANIAVQCLHGIFTYNTARFQINSSILLRHSYSYENINAAKQRALRTIFDAILINVFIAHIKIDGELKY